MHNTFLRIGVLTAMLILAAGAAALATISVSPSHSVTLETRVKGMGGNPDKDSVTITATSHGASKLNLTANTCRDQRLVDTSGYETSSSSTSETGRAPEQTHTASIHLTSRQQVGECELTFSDGVHHVIVRVHIVKP